MAAEPDRTDPNLDSREARVALNKTRFRDINERLARGLRRLPERPRLLEFICECGQRDCQNHVQLTLDEYEAIRSDSRRFAVVPGHVRPEIECVVAGTTRYEVVEKTGAAERIADARSQRSPGASGLRAPEQEPRPDDGARPERPKACHAFAHRAEPSPTRVLRGGRSHRPARLPDTRVSAAYPAEDTQRPGCPIGTLSP